MARAYFCLLDVADVLASACYYSLQARRFLALRGGNTIKSENLIGHELCEFFSMSTVTASMKYFAACVEFRSGHSTEL